MKSPVDYFSEEYLARDTVRRALGQKIVPPIAQWSSESNKYTDRKRYEILIGDRKYIIDPLIKSKLVRGRMTYKHGSYEIRVIRANNTHYVDTFGVEHVKIYDSASIYALKNVLDAVNRHLYRYPT